MQPHLLAVNAGRLNSKRLAGSRKWYELEGESFDRVQVAQGFEEKLKIEA